MPIVTASLLLYDDPGEDRVPFPEPGSDMQWRNRLGLLFLLLPGIILVTLPLWKPKPAALPFLTPRIIWTFEPPQRGGIVAGLALHDDRLYTTVVRDTGMSTSGAAYCLNRYDGKVLWEFDDQRRMLHTISTPFATASEVYFGEGLHGDLPCRLYCLNAADGSKKWDYPVGGHIESGPILVTNLLCFTAGDDGLHALDARKGTPRWIYRGSGHIDAAPWHALGKLYGGSAWSRQYRTTEIFCIDLESGKPIWRVPSSLPVWGRPIEDQGELFVPVGNGRLTASEPPPGKPAGALLCLEAESGGLRWRCEVDDSVLTHPALDRTHVYFGCRDGYCYAADRRKGKLTWEHSLGSPIVASPALREDRLVVVASDGLVVCLDTKTGKRRWKFDLAAQYSARPRLLSAPLLASGPQGELWIYLGTELRSEAGSTALLFCLEEP